MVINSGYRCAVHNRAVGGARQSQHLLGNAADIVVANAAPDEVAVVSEKIGFFGLGSYNGFTHVDVRLGKNARWVG